MEVRTLIPDSVASGEPSETVTEIQRLLRQYEMARKMTLKQLARQDAKIAEYQAELQQRGVAVPEEREV